MRLQSGSATRACREFVLAVGFGVLKLALSNCAWLRTPCSEGLRPSPKRLDRTSLAERARRDALPTRSAGVPCSVGPRPSPKRLDRTSLAERARRDALPTRCAGVPCSEGLRPSPKRLDQTSSAERARRDDLPTNCSGARGGGVSARRRRRSCRWLRNGQVH